MDTDFLVFLAIAFGVVGVVLSSSRSPIDAPPVAACATVLSRIKPVILKQATPTSFVGRVAISS